MTASHPLTPRMASGADSIAAAETCQPGSPPSATPSAEPALPDALRAIREQAVSPRPLAPAQATLFIEDAQRQRRALRQASGERPSAPRPNAAEQSLGAGRLHLARSLVLAARGPVLAETPEHRARVRLGAAELFRDVARFSADRRQRTWASGELAELYLDANRIGEATRLARRALAAAEADADLLAKVRFGRTLAFALEAGGDRAGAVRLLRSTAALGESLRRDRLGRIDPASAAGAARDAEAFALTTRRLLSMLLDEVEAADGDRTSALDAAAEARRQSQLAEIRDLVETQRSAEVEDYFQDACLAPPATSSTPNEAPRALTEALIVYPLLLEDRVGLLAELGGQLYYFRSPSGPSVVADRAAALRKLIEKRTTRQFLRPAGDLYEALIRPLEDLLRGNAESGRPAASAFVVVADGPLRTIPFAALYDAPAKRYLVDRLPVAHVPSMRLTRPGPIQREAVRLLAAGLGEASGGFSALDYTEGEIRQLAERFPGRVLWGSGFQIDALETEIRTRPYSIVHVATHGRVEPSGEESFLVTHDGRLGLDQMAQMIQTTRFRQDQPLELLTLSACETAGGDGRAALGLAGVAVRAGARSALATLWPVNDEATAQLIERFYIELMKPGQSRAGALRIAQQSIREQPRFRHPGYWAPFLMISNWL